MDHNYYYEYENIILRPLNNNDIENLRILRNKNKKYFLSQLEITTEQQALWMQQYLSKDNDIMFSVERKNEHGFIGAIAIYDINYETKSAEIGRILIDRAKVAENGYGTLALRAIVCFAFEQLKLTQLTSVILKWNQRSIRIHEKAGFILSSEAEETYILSRIYP